MGRDKGLASLHDQPMITHVLKVLRPFEIPLNIIAHNAAYEVFGLPVYGDVVQEKGPMGGLLTAMNNTDARIVLVIACDMPFITSNAVEVLLKNSDEGLIVTALKGKRIHPLFGLYPVALKEKLEQSISAGDLKMTDFILKNPHVLLPFESERSDEIFRNINTEEERKEAEKKWKN